MVGRGKREIPKKTRRPAASSDTILTCEDPGVTQTEIEPDYLNEFVEWKNVTRAYVWLLRRRHAHSTVRTGAVSRTAARRSAAWGVAHVHCVTWTWEGEERATLAPPARRCQSEGLRATRRTDRPACRCEKRRSCVVCVRASVCERACALLPREFSAPAEPRRSTAFGARRNFAVYTFVAARTMLGSGLQFLWSRFFGGNTRSITPPPSTTPPSEPEQSWAGPSQWGAAEAERLDCPPLKENWVQTPAGSLRIFASGNRTGRRRWSAGFFRGCPVPLPHTSLHSGAAPYSPQSPSSALNTLMLTAADISELHRSVSLWPDRDKGLRWRQLANCHVFACDANQSDFKKPQASDGNILQKDDGVAVITLAQSRVLVNALGQQYGGFRPQGIQFKFTVPEGIFSSYQAMALTKAPVIRTKRSGSVHPNADVVSEDCSRTTVAEVRSDMQRDEYTSLQFSPLRVEMLGTLDGRAWLTLIASLLLGSRRGKQARLSLSHLHFEAGPWFEQRIECSPPTKANRVRVQASLLPDFRRWELCRAMPLVGGFCRGSPTPSPPLHSGAASYLPRFNLIGSQDLDVKSRPKLPSLLLSLLRPL
ncbi:hypothetical protein PR048_012303 [Dryococelus australis]|uniref:Uncharacterized protein n=1 Tax=Dryococelus australis TaxID=614101 RepID=A0ABQ9HNY8_9NEOP|nr:hypothetical protein PR048_012303 [Dryococelus australis]